MIDSIRLLKVTQAIQAVCPVHGLSADGRIDFKDEATASQRQAAVTMMAQVQAGAKTRQEDIAAWKARMVATGFAVKSLGFALSVEPAAASEFTRLDHLLTRATGGGRLRPSDVISIYDKDRILRTVTVTDALAFLLDYGMHLFQLWVTESSLIADGTIPVPQD